MMCLTFTAYNFQVTLNPLQSSQVIEKESALKLCYIPFNDFFTKSLHFCGKLIFRQQSASFPSFHGTFHSVLT